MPPGPPPLRRAPHRGHRCRARPGGAHSGEGPEPWEGLLSCDQEGQGTTSEHFTFRVTPRCLVGSRGPRDTRRFLHLPTWSQPVAQLRVHV